MHRNSSDRPTPLLRSAWRAFASLFIALAMAAHAIAQAPASTADAPPQMSAEDLDKLVGRIALYPDDLVAIILPASTNPLQIVQADRYLVKRKADPKAPLGFRLPFHLETGEFLAARWKRWQQHDPIRLVGKYARNLKTLKGIYVDCGWRDQYHLHFGARILARQLAAHNVKHLYEEFDDSHSSIDYRMDVSLPFLYGALKP